MSLRLRASQLAAAVTPCLAPLDRLPRLSPVARGTNLGPRSTPTPLDRHGSWWASAMTLRTPTRNGSLLAVLAAHPSPRTRRRPHLPPSQDRPLTSTGSAPRAASSAPTASTFEPRATFTMTRRQPRYGSYFGHYVQRFPSAAWLHVAHIWVLARS